MINLLKYLVCYILLLQLATSNNYKKNNGNNNKIIINNSLIYPVFFHACELVKPLTSGHILYRCMYCMSYMHANIRIELRQSVDQ